MHNRDYCNKHILLMIFFKKVIINTVVQTGIKDCFSLGAKIGVLVSVATELERQPQKPR